MRAGPGPPRLGTLAQWQHRDVTRLPCIKNKPPGTSGGIATLTRTDLDRVLLCQLRLSHGLKCVTGLTLYVTISSLFL